MKNEFEILFDSFLDLTEFTLVKYPDGWGVIDGQCSNIGDIESDRFKDAMSVIDRMDIYIEDYLVRPIKECLELEDCDMNWGDMAKKLLNNAGESEGDVRMLDAICNHADQIRLENCTHETRHEKIYTVIFRSYADGTSVVSFRNLKDAIKYIKDDADGVESELIKQQYKPERTVCLEQDTEIYVPDSDIYYEWNIEESKLY